MVSWSDIAIFLTAASGLLLGLVNAFLQGRRESREGKINQDNNTFAQMNNLITLLNGQLTTQQGQIATLMEEKSKDIEEKNNLKEVILEREKTISKLQSSVDELTLRQDALEKHNAITPEDKKKISVRAKRHLLEISNRKPSEKLMAYRINLLRGE